MAKQPLYKIVNAATRDLGDAGAQINIGEIGKIDAQGLTGHLRNVVLSVIVNDYPDISPVPGLSTPYQLPGFVAYLTTGASWSDDQIITARAFLAGDTVSLAAYRRIEADSAQTKADFGKVYLWLEATDIHATENTVVRYVAETWGRWIDFTEV